MQSSSTSSVEAAVEDFLLSLASFDVEGVPGSDAAGLLQSVSSLVDRLTLLRDQLAHRVVSSSGIDPSQVATSTGMSRHQVRASLGRARAMAQLPDVREAVEAASLSLSKAEVIARAAGDDSLLAAEILESSSWQNVEELSRTAQRLQAERMTLSKREQLRRSQYVTISKDGKSMITGHFRLLPEHAIALLEAERRASGGNAWDRAESFASLLGSSTHSRRPSVTFHLELRWQDGCLDLADRCEQVGVGPVAKATVFEILETASKALVGHVDNKLVWFSTQDSRRPAVELPEYIKRAIRESTWNICSIESCVNEATDVDHVEARTNGGLHQIHNLQPLCVEHHRDKTREDAPWTNGGIYGPEARWRTQRRRLALEQQVTWVDLPADADAGADQGELFDDTG